MTVRLQPVCDASENAAKAGCYHCGAVSGGMFDMDVVIEGEGRLFFCKEVGDQMARLLGYRPPAEVEELTERCGDLADSLKAVQTALRDKEELIAVQSASIERYAEQERARAEALDADRKAPPTKPKPKK